MSGKGGPGVEDRREEVWAILTRRIESNNVKERRGDWESCSHCSSNRSRYLVVVVLLAVVVVVVVAIVAGRGRQKSTYLEPSAKHLGEI